jgi:hypothetical protein
LLSVLGCQCGASVLAHADGVISVKYCVSRNLNVPEYGTCKTRFERVTSDAASALQAGTYHHGIGGIPTIL